MKKLEGPRRRLGILALSALLIMAALPVGTALAEPPDLPIEPTTVGPDGGGPFVGMLDRLSELLQRLEGELAALEGPRAERLEQGIEQAIEAIENLLDEIEGPGEKPDERARKARLMKLDLHLHRLVHLLEEIVEKTPDRRPERPRAKASIEQLREWIDLYLAEASVGMDSEEYARFERAVRQMAKFLGERIAEMAKKAPVQAKPSKLAHLVERLEALLFRLDGFILNQPPKRP